MNKLFKKIIFTCTLIISMFTVVQASQEKLVLNGEGMREAFWVDVFKLGLYLPEKSSDANKIISADEAMKLRITIVSSLVNSDKMIDGLVEGFEEDAYGDIKQIEKEINTLKTIFKEDLGKDDVFDFLYVPGEGTKVFKNDTLKGKIAGLPFKESFFSIWIGDKNDFTDMKNGLLGK